MNGCGGEQSYGFVKKKKKLSCFLNCHTTSEYIGMIIKENAEHINYQFINPRRTIPFYMAGMWIVKKNEIKICVHQF